MIRIDMMICYNLQADDIYTHVYRHNTPYVYIYTHNHMLVYIFNDISLSIYIHICIYIYTDR